MIECFFCATSVPDVDAACEADWIPSFWDLLGTEVCVPVCPECQVRNLVPDGDHSWHVRPYEGQGV